MSVLVLLIPCAAVAQTLKGSVDIHVHCDPDVLPRSLDALEVAKEARAAGMRAVIYKNHYVPTASWAFILREAVPGIELFGGIDLNRTVGGINPAAVANMAKVKGGFGKIVWMPTFDAQNQVRYSKEDRPYVAVSKDGKLLPEVLDVLRIIAQNRLILETGHSSPEECLMLVRAGREAGIKNIVVTHAMAPPVKMNVEQMKQAAAMGAYLEFVYNDLIGPAHTNTIEGYSAAIRAVGVEHCILASDLGQAGNPHPAAGLLEFYKALHARGFSEAEIDRMGKINPAKVLGLQ
ncbi:MAG: DUF6282 family protein [Deltaproteobacteria bacterium]